MFDPLGALGGGEQETAAAEPAATKKSARDALFDDIGAYDEPTKVGVDPLAQEKGRAEEEEKKISVARPPGQVRRAENVSKPMSISEKEAMEEALNANYSASKVDPFAAPQTIALGEESTAAKVPELPKADTNVEGMFTAHGATSDLDEMFAAAKKPSGSTPAALFDPTKKAEDDSKVDDLFVAKMLSYDGEPVKGAADDLLAANEDDVTGAEEDEVDVAVLETAVAPREEKRVVKETIVETNFPSPGAVKKSGGASSEFLDSMFADKPSAGSDDTAAEIDVSKMDISAYIAANKGPKKGLFD